LYLKEITGSDGSELAGKKIALCVTASVSIIEAPRIARTLMRHGADVTVVLTREAAELVSPAVFEWSTGNKPVAEITGRVEHVALTASADAVVVAPCTANSLSKFASGISDDPVSILFCTYLGSGKPIVIAPAMHEPMLRNPILEEVMDRLRKVGVVFVSGRLEESKSKIATPEDILSATVSALSSKESSSVRESSSSSLELQSLGFLITAGPTREPIDQVRFISNGSSGKMGVALARACSKGGAGDVCLIAGPGVSVPDEVKDVKMVVTTEDMLRVVLSELDSGKYDILISAGAPADYQLARPEKGKISTSGREHLSLELGVAPKIIKVAKEKHPEVCVVSFKAEYGQAELLRRSKESMEKSGADLVVANDVSRQDIGFGSDQNEVTLIPREGEPKFLKRAPKEKIAEQIIEFVIDRRLVSF
jgi:phosphopantothenoylcysteine decarboxylase / phosphopantothenate---cysteine ligase